MAWLDRDPSGYFHIAFRLGDRKFKRSLKVKDQVQAAAACARLEENLRFVEAGRLEIPTGGDVVTFLLSDGKLNGKPVVPQVIGLHDLFVAYERSVPIASLEPETIRIARIHMNHLERHLGKRFPIGTLTHSHLQNYVSCRAKSPGRRGRPLSATTIRKELSTFSTVWAWALAQNFVTGPFPCQGLRFSKTAEKPRFQTFVEIERQVALGGLSDVEKEELWDCLFLTLVEIEEVLEVIRANSQYDFLYPMVVMAAHTGARRSELVRSRIGDFDLKTGTVEIREKKRDKERLTTRRVTLSPKLRAVMAEWFSRKRSSVYVFPCEWKVRRERKQRGREQGDAVSVDEASHHLGQALAGSKWEKIRGWHVFRHSFISNCAAKGIDQRMIDRWSGHQTEEMRKRYTHLFPDSQRKAIEQVFGAA
jgi:integrase